MDLIDREYIRRAQAALGMLDQTPPRANDAKAFTAVAAEIALARTQAAVIDRLVHSEHMAVAKAATHHGSTDALWADADMRRIAEAFIASVGEPDLLSLLKQHARALPSGGAPVRALIASGATANVIAEGAPKVIRRMDMMIAEGDLLKAVAAVVVSKELLTLGGEAGRRLFEDELARAVVRSVNAAIAAGLIDSTTTNIAAASDPLASLRAGLLVAGPSAAYIVTAPATWVAWLSTAEANHGGAGVRGGRFADGIELVALDDASSMTIIPADRLAVLDGGLDLRPSDAATVDMADSPQAAGEKVSLWQSNLLGLMVERSWRVEGDVSGVVVVG
jgi:hypothetical protein